MKPNKSLLLIYAHPDDETVFTGGTVSKCSSLGIDVYLLCATSGEKGKTSGICSQEQLSKVREQELNNVAKLLGIKEIIYLRYPDKQLDNVNKDEIVNKIAEVILRVCPSIIITFGPDGATGHIDHKAMNEYATRAYDLTCRNLVSKQVELPLNIPELFYVSLLQTIREEWGIIEDYAGPNAKINIKEYTNLKVAAIEQYKTQSDSLSKFLNIREEVLKLFLEQETFLHVNEHEDKLQLEDLLIG